MIMNCMYRGTSILEPLFKDVFIITNDNLYPRNSKIYEKKNSIQRTSVQRSSHYNGRYSSPQKLVKYIRKNDLNITKPFYRERILPSLRYLMKTLLSVLQPTSEYRNTKYQQSTRDNLPSQSHLFARCRCMSSFFDGTSSSPITARAC